jgi:hypothetical protein
MLSWLSPSTAFSAYASGPRDPPGPGAPRASTLVLGHPRTPASTRRTGTRPSLTAGRPTARTRPGPLTRHAPTLPRARGAQLILDPDMHPTSRTPTRDRVRRPDHDSSVPTLGRPRSPSGFLGPWLEPTPRPEGFGARSPRRARLRQDPKALPPPRPRTERRTREHVSSPGRCRTHGPEDLTASETR